MKHAPLTCALVLGCAALVSPLTHAGDRGPTGPDHYLESAWSKTHGHILVAGSPTQYVDEWLSPPQLAAAGASNSATHPFHCTYSLGYAYPNDTLHITNSHLLHAIPADATLESITIYAEWTDTSSPRHLSLFVAQVDPLGRSSSVIGTDTNSSTTGGPFALQVQPASPISTWQKPLVVEIEYRVQNAPSLRLWGARIRYTEASF